MDQRRFESEVRRELAEETPPASADESLDASEAAASENDEDEGYEEDSMEDALVEEMDTFEEGGEESFFDGDEFDEGSADEASEEGARQSHNIWLGYLTRELLGFLPRIDGKYVLM